MISKIRVGILVIAAGVYMFACSSSSNSTSSANAPAATSSSSASPSVGNGNSAPSATPTDFGAMKTVEITDPMFNNMVVETMTIPATWDFEGAVLHGPGCKGDYWSIVFRMNSPDMKYGIQAVPQINWYWADDERAKPKGPACKDAPLMSAAEYGTMASLKMRPGSTIETIEKAPSADSVAASTEKANQAYQQQAQQLRIQPMHQTSDAKRLLLHYDLNGQPEDEWMSVIMTVVMMPTPVIVSRPGEILRSGYVPSYTSSVYSQTFRAPKGQLQASYGLFASIAASTKVNPQYQNTLFAWMRDQNNRAIAASWQTTHSILQQGAAAGEQLRQNAQRFIANMRAEGQARNDNFNAMMQQRSAHAAEVSDYLLDQQFYVNPTTGQTSTHSSGAGATYSNGNGTVVQSTNPTYNPNGLLAGNWTELQPIHH